MRHAEQTGSLQWFTIAHEYVQGKDWRLMMIYGHLGRRSCDFIFPKFVHLQENKMYEDVADFHPACCDVL